MYWSNPFSKTCKNAEYPFDKPFLHEADSRVMEMVIAWAFGKFIACPVPEDWFLENEEGEVKDLDAPYRGVCYLTIGNILIDRVHHRCLVIKDIIHDDWDPSPLPQEGESLAEWHARLVVELKKWEARRKDGIEDYITMRPVTKLVVEELDLDWNNFNLDDIHAKWRLHETDANVQFRSACAQVLPCAANTSQICLCLSASACCKYTS